MAQRGRRVSNWIISDPAGSATKKKNFKMGLAHVTASGEEGEIFFFQNFQFNSSCAFDMKFKLEIRLKMARGCVTCRARRFTTSRLRQTNKLGPNSKEK